MRYTGRISVIKTLCSKSALIAPSANTKTSHFINFSIFWNKFSLFWICFSQNGHCRYYTLHFRFINMCIDNLSTLSLNNFKPDWKLWPLKSWILTIGYSHENVQYPVLSLQFAWIGSTTRTMRNRIILGFISSFVVLMFAHEAKTDANRTIEINSTEIQGKLTVYKWGGVDSF